ncbi:MAG: hypothetical protein BWY82_01820 [Verrucomicrobia bacterium ADurb.Bin474]|nr:MAG: hypothetical protein BWY82_01820 [Verrucomicrobia bacterium ADurb.Bin474]
MDEHRYISDLSVGSNGGLDDWGKRGDVHPGTIMTCCVKGVCSSDLSEDFGNEVLGAKGL